MIVQPKQFFVRGDIKHTDPQLTQEDAALLLRSIVNGEDPAMAFADIRKLVCGIPNSRPFGTLSNRELDLLTTGRSYRLFCYCDSFTLQDRRDMFNLLWSWKRARLTGLLIRQELEKARKAISQYPWLPRNIGMHDLYLTAGRLARVQGEHYDVEEDLLRTKPKGDEE